MAGDSHQQSVTDVDLSNQETLTHEEAMSRAQGILSRLISSDPFLSDLPKEVTVEEVNSQLALEYGQAISVTINRADGEKMRIVIVQDATVLDLKHAIKRYVVLKQARKNGVKCLSWRYVWKRYWLYFDGQKLSDDKKTLREYGIQNKSELTFIKRLRQK